MLRAAGWFTFGFVVFLLWRSFIPLIWDDSPILAQNIHTQRWNLQTEGFWSDVLTDAFSHVARGGYRPLSEFTRNVGTALMSQHPPLLQIWIIAIALLYGLMFMSYAYLLREFGLSPPWIIFSLLLFFTSPAQLGASWVLFAGIQIIVPLWILLELSIYFRVRHHPKFPNRSIFALMILFIIGPWFREFTGVGPVLLIILEWFGPRRRPLLAFFTIGLLAAVFPTWLGALLWPEQVPIAPIYSVGSLGQQVADLGLRWQIFPVYWFFYPSYLWLSVVLALFIWAMKGQFRQHNNGQFKYLLFLFSFFALTFLPFLRVYTAPVHLAYSTVPLSMMVATLISRAVQIGSRSMRRILFVLLSLTILEQTLQATASRKLTSEILLKANSIGSWLKGNTPRDSFILTNVLLGEDIRLQQQGHNQFYYTFKSGVNDLTTVVDTSGKLQEFININKSKADIYFLVGDFEYTPDKSHYHSHRFAKRNCVRTEKIPWQAAVHSIQFSIDPIKYFVSRSHQAFLSSPDLENDFYRGPTQNRTHSVWKEVHSTFSLYQVIDSRVSCTVNESGL